ncbi:unnamed protein product [Staurois parvus]|uniref:Uncharacterized protein n=1 Tax=Staurois parvus TaxID=386267 RepID=A0ABN9AZD2_9NEOB|nr:unnamed protein product [Staurois parvus]
MALGRKEVNMWGDQRVNCVLCAVCSSGLPLLVLKCYPELHSGIPLRRLKSNKAVCRS